MLVKPGEDVVEPMLMFIAIPAYAIAANLAYTLGWLSELLWSGGHTDRTVAFRPRIFWLGTSFSAALTLAAAILFPVLWLIVPIR
jgi:hypothetical protein